MKRWHWFEMALIALVMGIHLYAAFSAPHNFSTRWFIRDDAYYYFKVAQNITEGHGVSFDGINPTNGFHPLWMIICIPIFSLARFDLILPLRILLLVMAVLSTATSILLFRLLRRTLSEPAAVLGASFWALNMSIHGAITQNGMETGILAFSVVLFLTMLEQFERKNQTGPVTLTDIAKLALAAALVLMSRLDTIYLLALAGVWIVFRRTAIRYLGLADLFATLALTVSAYVNRAGIKIYLFSYSDSALAFAALAFVVQFIAFYFLGLYRHPRRISIFTLLRQSAIGVTIATLFATGAMFALTAAEMVTLPRAVPIIYWIGSLLLTLSIRLLLRLLAPQPASEPETASPLEQFRTSWRGWLGEGAIFYGIWGSILGIYMLYNKLTIGTPMPVSGQIKRWWGSMSNNVYGGGATSLLDIFGIDPETSTAWWLVQHPFNQFFEQYIAPLLKKSQLEAGYWLMILLIMVLALVIFYVTRKKIYPAIFKTGIILLGFSAMFHVFLFGAVSYAARHEWYWLMEMLSLVIMGSILLHGIFELLPRQDYSKLIVWGVVGIFSISQAWQFSSVIIDRMPYVDPHEGEPYIDMLINIENYTEPGSIIGMTGGGNIGYYITDRTIVNMDGLINSYDYFQALKSNQGGEYLEKIGLDYVFANPYILLSSAPYNTQFQGRIEPIPDTVPYGRKELWRFIQTDQ